MMNNLKDTKSSRPQTSAIARIGVLTALAATAIGMSGCNSSDATKLSSTASVAGTKSAASTEPIIMGYYANWDQYSPTIPGASTNYLFSSAQTRAKLTRLNTVNYAFFETASDGTIQATDTWSDFTAADQTFCNSNPTICFANGTITDLTGGLGNFGAFANSGTTDGITNRLVAVGGATHDAQIENAMNNPTIFATSLATLKGQFPFNGVDIDYEPVGGMDPGYYPKLITLLQTIRQTMGPDFKITYTVSPNQNSIDAFGASNWKQVSQIVDYINVMGYDIFGPWEQKTGLQSPLYLYPNSGGSDTYSDDTAIDHMKNNGVPLSQIILGVPAYGRAVANAAANGLGQTYNGLYSGDLDQAGCLQANNCTGMMTYSGIVNSGYTMVDVTAQANNNVIGAYSNFNQSGFGNVFTSYDDPTSIKYKTLYAQNSGLAGVMMWDLNYDAPVIGTDGNPNSASLLNTINQTYGITPRPIPAPTGPYFILQISNTATSGANPYAAATLVVNGGYYVFGSSSNAPIAVQANQPWGTLASSQNPQTPNVPDNGNLDKFFTGSATSFTASSIIIDAYPSASSPLSQPASQVACATTNYTFEAGHSYNLMVNPTFGTCAITQLQ